MEFELNEVSQTVKDKYYMVSRIRDFFKSNS